METLVLASGNTGKLRELTAMLMPLGIKVTPQSEYKVEDVEETGLTFVENAILKARHASQISGLPALADDSGLEVDHLQGRPGIYSARFAGPDARDPDNNAKLLDSLDGVPDAQRGAEYQCVLVLMRHHQDPTPLIVQGSWRGRILTEPRGDGGFGYDPLFWCEQEQCTAAELQPQRKAALSHRGKALAKLLERLGPGR